MNSTHPLTRRERCPLGASEVAGKVLRLLRATQSWEQSQKGAGSPVSGHMRGPALHCSERWTETGRGVGVACRALDRQTYEDKPGKAKEAPASLGRSLRTRARCSMREQGQKLEHEGQNRCPRDDVGLGGGGGEPGRCRRKCRCEVTAPYSPTTLPGRGGGGASLPGLQT